MRIQENQADYIYSALRKNAVSLNMLNPGDLVVVTDEESDIVGFVGNVNATASRNVLPLITREGKTLISNAQSRYIHIIRRGSCNQIKMDDHHEYERDLKDIIGTHKDKHIERPLYSIDESNKSVLPTSKLSLSLRKKVD